MMVVVVTFYLMSLAMVMAKPLDVDFEETQFRGEEFEYFYNMELVEKLSLLGEDNIGTDDGFTVDELKEITDKDQTNDTEVDDVLDKLLEEGSKIENVLNEFTQSTAKTVELSENGKTKIDFSSSLLYEILYWILLICFVLMMLFSLVATGKYFLENPQTAFSGTAKINRADREFVFFTN